MKTNKTPLTPLTPAAFYILLARASGKKHGYELMFEGFILALYAALIVILMGYVRTFPRSEIRPMWVRLGLVLGGIFSLYVVAWCQPLSKSVDRDRQKLFLPP